MDTIYDYFVEGFENALARQTSGQRRIGAELKFPLVNPDGSAVDFEVVCALWDYLVSNGWQPVEDKMTGRVIGAKTQGPLNDTVAGCETGYCKAEFSMAHVGDLHHLQEQIAQLRQTLMPFCQQQNVAFLCYGIHPVTPPSKDLLMKKGRTSPWVKAFGSNRRIAKADGDDMHMFTVNAATHVHISIKMDEAIDAVNVLNGFSGAQIALMANSNIWQNQIDPDYKCVAEKFWDWWMPNSNRVGIPEQPFADIKDYIQTVAELKPVYAVRDGKPLILSAYDSFDHYYQEQLAVGVDPDGNDVSVTPHQSDIDLHNSCYWYNARISRYYTVENRANDQQPPDALLAASALTLGLVSAVRQAKEALEAYDWQTLRQLRHNACQHGLHGEHDGISLEQFAGQMVDIARMGLSRRGRGEEKFIEPIEKRLDRLECPADQAARIFQSGGADELVEKWKF